MATAEELLRTVNPETEPHIVISADRTVTVPPELRTIAVQFDHNIETVIFDCPRYWDNHDMSEMMVFVNYMRADGKAFSYTCEDVTVDEVDDTIMHFSWTISGNVTPVTGQISFLVCVKAANEEGELENQWSSHLNQEMKIANGLDASDEIVEMDADIITSILAQIQILQIKSNRQMNWDENRPAANTYIKNRPLYLTSTSVTWSGDETAKYLSELQPSGHELVGGTVKVTDNGSERELPIVAYLDTQEKYDEFVMSDMINTDCAFVVTDDLAWGTDPLVDVIMDTRARYLATVNRNHLANKVGIYANVKVKQTDSEGNVTYYHLTELKWDGPTVDPRYKSAFSNEVDWNHSLGDKGFVHNRPLYLNEYNVAWDDGKDADTDTLYRVSIETPSVEDLINSTVKFVNKGYDYEWPIIGYCLTSEDIKDLTSSQYNTEYLYIATGNSLGLANIADVRMPNGTSIVSIYYDHDDYDGIYAKKVAHESDGQEDTTYTYFVSMNWGVPVVDKRYERLFKGNVHVVAATSNDVSSVDFDSYSPGDIILVVTS